DGRPHIGLTLGGRQDIVPLALARRDIEHRGDPAGARTLQHSGLILGQPLVIQVAMAVGEPHAASLSSSRGNTPLGAGSAVPATMGCASAVKSRASALWP